MKKSLIIFSVAIFFIVHAFGQNDVSPSNSLRQLNIGLGVIHYQLKDNVIAPLRWDGLGFTANFTYSFISDKGRHNIELRLPYAGLTNRYGHKNKVMEINFGYSYIHRVTVKESRVQIHLGGLIDWNDNLQYYDSWDDSHLYWLNAYELGPAVRWNQNIGDNHQLVVNFNFPVFAIVSRPPEHRYYDQEDLPRELFSKPHENFKVTSVHEYMSFDLHGKYIYTISRKVSLGASYLMHYRSFPEPKHITLYTNTIQLNLSINFGDVKKEKS